MNDPQLAFTQHAVSAKPRQRQESYFTRMMATYYDFVYRGHYLFSAVTGCPPPLTLVGLVIRTSALQQCAKVRMLRKTQRWLRNVGIEFLSVDQVGLGNLAKTRRMEYWAEDRINCGFEAMLELYNLGFTGRYILIPNIDFQVRIPSTFDEFSSQQRIASMGAHEVVFNCVTDMIGGASVFSKLFKTLLRSTIPSYYKGYLISSLFSYFIGGTFFFCFVIGAIMRIFHDVPKTDRDYYNFSASTAIATTYIGAFLIGNLCFMIAIFRVRFINPSLLAEKRRWCFSTLGDLCRYILFQVFVEPVASASFSCLGALDHLLIRSISKQVKKHHGIFRKRWESFAGTVAWNIGSWYLGIIVAALAYATGT